MITKLLLASLTMAITHLGAQNISAVYKTNQLLERIGNKDTVYVLNFWATWCKPCVQELPAFDSLNTAYAGTTVKVLLVSLDFHEGSDQKVNTFLKKKNIRSECVLLDEVNGNDYIDRISPDWSGSIPATLIKTGNKKRLIEKKMHLGTLKKEVEAMLPAAAGSAD